MKRALTDISTVRKRLDIEIPQEVVDEEITKIAREIGRRARVPGFRPGKAPLGVVRNRYRDDILSETCQNLLPRYFADAAREEGLAVVDAPAYEEIDHGPGKPLRFTATFEVYPALDITNHSNIPIEAVPTEVTEDEVDQALERLVGEHSEMTPVEEDRPARAGDFVEITFRGSLVGDEAAGEGSPEEPFSGEKALCEIGGATTISEFTENLTGARAGEEKTFGVRYRDDHPDSRLAGKTARYRVHVESLKQKRRPEPNDEFAQSLGEYKTAADLRDEIRRNLESHKKEHAEQQTRDALLEWLEDHNEFEVPETLVEHQLQVRLERLMRDLARQGINPKRLDVDWGKIRQDQYENALRDVRGSLILDHLAQREGIDVSEEEVDLEIAKTAEGMNQPPARIREALERNGGIERIRGQIRNNKVLALLGKQARVLEAGSLSKGGSAD